MDSNKNSVRKSRRHARGYLRRQRERAIGQRVIEAMLHGIEVSSRGFFAKRSPLAKAKRYAVRHNHVVHVTDNICQN